MIVRKGIITVFSVIFYCSLWAQNVSPDQAVSIAGQILGRPFSVFEQPIYLEDQKLFLVQTDTGEGWVLISSSTDIDPVIGYSKTGRFATESSNSPAMEFIAANLPSRTKTAELNWLRATEGTLMAPNTRGSVAPLLSTEWGQLPPYNNATPLINGEHTVTGCNATAMAQIMAYHKYPDKGVGQKTYTSTYVTGEISADFSAQTYNWENMSDNDIATIMFHYGVAVEMEYDLAEGGSGSDIYEVIPATVRNFKYDSDASLLESPYYSNSEWVAILKNELDNKRPVFYAGPGHAFIIDGYDDAGLFHVNWGWDGYHNGYYNINSLKPGSYDFTGEHSMIIGIQPNDNYDKESSSVNLTTTDIRFFLT